MDGNFTLSAEEFELGLKIYECRETQDKKHELEHEKGVVYCYSVYDGINCLPYTKAGSTVTAPCPPALSAPAHIVGTRTCGKDGHWTSNTTDYNACLEYLNQLLNQTTPSPEENTYESTWAPILRDIYFITSIMSLVFLLFTIFIFCSFRSLQCNRIKIHKHLVVSYIIRFIVIIVMLEPLVIQHVDHSFLVVSWLCKVMTTLNWYTVLTNMYWMFVEGLFLHNSIVVSVFNTEAPFKLFIFIGWVFPVIPMLVWVIVMIFLGKNDCWREENPHLGWIIFGPFVLALVANLLFMINIIRVLITKLRARNTHESSVSVKALKATLILLPLLGLTNLFFLWKPNDKGILDIMYSVVNAVLQGMQGVLISVFYCLNNGEVRRVLRRKYRRFKIKRHLKSSGRRRSSRTSSFIMSQTETHHSSSSDSNNFLPANNNRYINKADLILEVQEDLNEDICDSCNSISDTEPDTNTLKIDPDSNTVGSSNQSIHRVSKPNNVHFAMEGDTVKCETITSDKIKNPIGPVKEVNIKQSNLFSKNGERSKCDSDNSSMCLMSKYDNDEQLNTPLLNKMSESDTDIVSNRYSVISFGDVIDVVDGFTDEVSEEINRLLQR